MDATASPIPAGRLARIWLYVRYIIWLLWVGRVSTVSAVAALFLFANVPEAQDLFLEFQSPEDCQGNGQAGRFTLTRIYFFWILFVFALQWIWVLPVYFSARAIIQRCDTFAPRDGAMETIRIIIPLFLGACCIVATLVGQVYALGHIPTVITASPGAPLSRCAESSIAALSTWLLIQATLQLLVLYSVFRVYVEVLKRRVKWILLWVLLAGFTGVGAAWYFAFYFMFSQEFSDSMGARTLAFLFSPTLIFIAFSALMTLILYFRARKDGAPPSGSRLLRPLVLWIVTVGLLVMVLFNPFFLAETILFQRALLAPIMLGAWVPLFTVLAYFSHRWKAPVILIVLLIPAGIALVIGDNHDVRRLSASTENSVRRIELNNAIMLWREKNCTRDECPAPVIAVAAGGGSRAAYFTASVLGDLMDADTGPNGQPFDQRLFALSTVSGSSLAAVVFATALDDADAQGNPPCGESDSTQHQWRDCLQKLIAGDFLSPVLISMAFKDLFRLPLEDRAITLERAWERRYAHVTRGQPDADDNSLQKSFTSLAPVWNAPSDPGNQWRPILILNGASSETGRRIIVSPLLSEFDDRSSPKVLFNDSYDLYEMFGAKTAPGTWMSQLQAGIAEACEADNVAAQCDIRRSTAVTMSARFPVVSPHGNIRNAEGNIIDRVVDGGYFEVFGATSAMELAAAIKGINPDVRPRILLITNEPSMPLDLPCLAPDERGPDEPLAVCIDAPESSTGMPDADDVEWLTHARVPLRGLFESRNARGTWAAIQLCEAYKQDGGFQHVRVFPQRLKDGDDGEKKCGKTPLSVSWWLSNPVQTYLRDQLGVGRNRAVLNRVARDE